jgi:DNA-binding CsgD family transcriptional regulator
MAPAMGWIARGRRVLEESGEACAEEGWLLLLTGLPIMFQGDPTSAMTNFEQALEIATRFGDADLITFARLAYAQTLCMTGNATGGIELLDEVMVAVIAGEVSPIISGIVYCATIMVCNMMFDLRRAREWTAALTRWTESQPDLVPYRGACLVHRCEVFQLQGAWPRALASAQQATAWLAGPPPWDTLGYAHYEVGEIQRLRGAFVEAEESYRTASQHGHEPEPGLSLLRLEQGRIDVAAAAIRRVLDETHDPSTRPKVLEAHVHIMLGAGDLTSARASAEELQQIASFVRAPYLDALAADTAGRVLLAEGEARAALTKLREARTAWHDLDAPHHAARVRVPIALACRELGDEGTAEMELDAARVAFEELGAAADLARLRDLTGAADTTTAGGLSPREVEVLRLVAAGNTNRAIAKELVVSEKTVARHVSNIFAKLGVPSRAAATAYAYEHGLV